MDSSGNLTAEHEAQGQTWNTFQVGRLDGQTMGSPSRVPDWLDIISRTSDSGDWTDHYGWWADDKQCWPTGPRHGKPRQCDLWLWLDHQHATSGRDSSTDGDVFEAVQAGQWRR